MLYTALAILLLVVLVLVRYGAYIFPAKEMSIIKSNALKNPTYAPYCGRCSGLVRMVKIDTLFWRCRCGAVHDERDHEGRSIRLSFKRPLVTYLGYGLPVWVNNNVVFNRVDRGKTMFFRRCYKVFRWDWVPLYWVYGPEEHGIVLNGETTVKRLPKNMQEPW